jgi:hypothetical protein
MRNREIEQHETYWLGAVILTAICGFIAVVVYALGQQDPWTVFACASLIALAAFVAGALLGFIFGIPKTVTKSAMTAAAGGRSIEVEYEGNTNLEQISDWLTKILVGAGLVQLGQLGPALGSIGETLHKNKILGTGAIVVGPSLIVSYAICGFILAYLWARIYLKRQLEEADRGAGPEYYLGVMNAALYSAKPEGFSTTLDVAERMVARGVKPSHARFWVYVACARGQQYSYEKGEGARPERLQEIRDQALDAVKHALSMDARTRPMLHSFWIPDDDAMDDDLEVFRDDKEFIALLDPQGAPNSAQVP